MKQLWRIVEQFIPVTIVGLIWEVMAKRANNFLFPPISKIISTYPALVAKGELQAGFLETMKAFLLGFGLSILIGILVGLLMGRYRIINDILEPYVNALYSMPRAALVPIILIWFGVGFWGRIFLIFLGGSLPIVLNTAAGVRNVDDSLIEVGESFCAPESRMFQEIILPASLPFVMAGIRIGFGRALVGTIVAEFFLEITGLGGMVIRYGDAFVYPKMIAVILILSLIGIIFTNLLKTLESVIAPWNRDINVKD